MGKSMLGFQARSLPRLILRFAQNDTGGLALCTLTLHLPWRHPSHDVQNRLTPRDPRYNIQTPSTSVGGRSSHKKKVPRYENRLGASYVAGVSLVRSRG